MFYISFYSTSYFVCSSRSSLTPWFYIVIYNCYNYLSYFFKNSFFRIFKLYILYSSRSSSYSYSLLFSLYNYVQEDCHAFLTSWLDKRGNYTAELIFVFVSLSYFWQSPFCPDHCFPFSTYTDSRNYRFFWSLKICIIHRWVVDACIIHAFWNKAYSR